MSAAPRLFVCGGFALHGQEGGSPLRRLRTRKTEWLCAFLALQRGKWHPREALLARFWPEDDSLSARRKLRLALHSIRQVLGDRLQTEGDKVCLDQIWVDAFDLPAGELEDEDFLCGEHEGTLTDLLPSFEARWTLDLIQSLKEATDSCARRCLALKLRSLDPRSALAAEVLAEAKRRSASNGNDLRAGRGEHETDTLLETLALFLLGDNEPVAACLTGPPGVGKSTLAKRLVPLAEEDEIVPLFISLKEVATTDEVRTRVLSALMAGQPIQSQFRIEDLASTLLILDNADLIEPEAETFFRELLVKGSPVRILLTLPERRFESFMSFRCRPQQLPSEPSRGAVLASPAARLLAAKAGIDLALADPDKVYQACLATGGLPLALQLAAPEFLLSSFLEAGTGSRRLQPPQALAERLQAGWRRLSSLQREGLYGLCLLGHQFHPVLAEALGTSLKVINELWEASWIQLASDGRTYEILPPVACFIHSHTPKQVSLPHDWSERLSQLGRNLINGSHLLVPEVFAPALPLIKKALHSPEALSKADQGSLFSCLYFTLLQKADLEEVIKIGVRLYGSHPSPLWDDERAINFLGSAAFFHQDYDLAERVFRWLMETSSPRMRSLGFCNAGLVAQARGRFLEAVDLLSNSLEAEDLLPRQRTARLNNLAHALAGAGRLKEARSMAAEALGATSEAPDLVEIRSLALISLGGIALLKGDWSEAAEWSQRALASWGDEIQPLRRIEAVFLHASALAAEGVERAWPVLERQFPRLLKGPPLAAPGWAPFAAGLLRAADNDQASKRVLEGLTWPTTPFWLAGLLGSGPAQGKATQLPAPSNKERWGLFLEAMKHL